MRVMVTGATGFLGGHTMRALVERRHEVRALVRSPEKLHQMLLAHGIADAPVEPVHGDILDAHSVDEALGDCEAAIHSAAVTTLDPALMHKALAVNGPGTKVVLDAAVRAGCDPVVHLSTMAILFPPTGDRFDADGPVRDRSSDYEKSKAEADLYARLLQGAGRPIIVVYPGGLTGPTDVGVNVVAQYMAGMMSSNEQMKADTGGYLWVDVRDVGAALARLVERRQGPRRYMAGGRHVSYDDFAAAMSDATGRPRRTVLMNREQLNTVMDPDAVEITLGCVDSNDEPLQRDTGVAWRPLIDTLRDTARWLVQRGLLAPEWAPAVAPRPDVDG